MDWLELTICFGIAIGQVPWGFVFEMIPIRFFEKRTKIHSEEDPNSVRDSVREESSSSSSDREGSEENGPEEE